MHNLLCCDTEVTHWTPGWLAASRLLVCPSDNTERFQLAELTLGHLPLCQRPMDFQLAELTLGHLHLSQVQNSVTVSGENT